MTCPIFFKYVLFHSFALFFATMSFAQKVYSVEYTNQADVKVFVVDYESQADLKVYKVNLRQCQGC